MVCFILICLFFLFSVLIAVPMEYCHNVLIRSALQTAESQVINASLCVSCVTVFGLVTFMHDALDSINNHTPYQTLPGRQPHSLPPQEGGYHGDLDATGQNTFARVRQFDAVAIVEATARQRPARGDKRNQVAAMERSEHAFGDLVDIWYDPPNKDIRGWRGPAQIAIVNDGGADIILSSRERMLDSRYQEVRAFVPDWVFLFAPVTHEEEQCRLSNGRSNISHQIVSQ